MPESITLPGTIDDAVDALTGLGRLITAREWERAAIVAAFVRLAEREGRPSSDTGSGASFESPSQFAARGIRGLSSPNSVRRYVKVWLDAHDGNYPRPGATRRLPTIDFPAMRTGTDGSNSTEGLTETLRRAAQRHSPADIARAVRQSAPEAAAIVSESERWADRRGTTPDEEVEAVAERRRQTREMHDQREQQRRQRHTAAWIEADLLLLDAATKVRRAVEAAQGVTFSDEEADLLRERVGEMRNLLDLVALCADGTAEVDWDRELARLGGAS